MGEIAGRQGLMRHLGATICAISNRLLVGYACRLLVDYVCRLFVDYVCRLFVDARRAIAAPPGEIGHADLRAAIAFVKEPAAQQPVKE